MRHATGRLAVPGLALLAGLVGASCAPPPPPAPSPAPPPPPPPVEETWHETPVPDGPWRPHVLSRCEGEDRGAAAAEGALRQSYELFQRRSGSDAIMELELCLERSPREGLLLLQLAQLYILAGRGEPGMLPREGPARDVGNRARNRERLFGRAQSLLERARGVRPDDAAVDYLLGDVLAARGDSLGSSRAMSAGLEKCSLARSLDILRRFQGLTAQPARRIRRVSPEYPAEAGREGIGGEVVLDLLISPAGEMAQAVPVQSPDPRLTAAAAAAFRQSGYEPARLGKYPVWSWLRIPTQFTIAGQ